MSFPLGPSVGFLSAPGSTSRILAHWSPTGPPGKHSGSARRALGLGQAEGWAGAKAAHSSQQQSPHIVSALALQNTKRWTHSGGRWGFKGVEDNAWSQRVCPCRKENSPENAGSPCGDGSKAKFSTWFHSQLKFIPLSCKACDSSFTVSGFQFTNTG